MKDGEGELERRLVEELKDLRPAEGLTVGRLRRQPTLVMHLVGGNVKECLQTLVRLISEIRNPETRLALQYAYGVGMRTGNFGTNAGERRKRAAEKLLISLRTLDRREVDGIRELAILIIDQSPIPGTTHFESQRITLHSLADRVSRLEILLYEIAGKRLPVPRPWTAGPAITAGFWSPLQDDEEVQVKATSDNLPWDPLWPTDEEQTMPIRIQKPPRPDTGPEPTLFSHREPDYVEVHQDDFDFYEDDYADIRRSRRRRSRLLRVVSWPVRFTADYSYALVEMVSEARRRRRLEREAFTLKAELSQA